ncbi:MAG: competence/damage-inducible protein A [Chloroflexota bacterium]|nr:MAG: competence/damage-inducible protein A [Chloroflexota bacterium]
MRTILRAELLSIGSELTVGETRDTNSGELAASLTAEGVEVLRMTALPDDLPSVRDAFAAAIGRADLVVSTGGLGPTPDDLTRESIAAAIGETPSVDPDLEAWLRGLFERRGISFPAVNLKQAWVLPSATPIPNGNGTAPGWWVDLPDGQVIVALPGPPRELRPMWSDWALPRLRTRGLGVATATVTLRTTGLGESAIAERLGSLLDRGANPTIATYARADGVDIRISARPEAAAGPPDHGPRLQGDAPGPASDPAALLAAAEREVIARIGDHVWGRGDTTWPQAIAEALDTRGWSLAIHETGLRGALPALLSEGLGDRLPMVLSTIAPAGASADETPSVGDSASGRDGLLDDAQAVRASSGADVGLAVRATTSGGDMAVTIALVDPGGEHVERRLAFIAGPMGRSRAALLAAAVLLARLR